MNYEKIYYLLVDRARVRNLVFGYHKHHICPKSLGGSDSDDNIVKFTYREHFTAHLLLAKFIKGTVARKKMASAILRMSDKKKITSRQYALGISIARKNLQDVRVFDWYHEKFGSFIGTVSELTTKFKIDRTSNLFKVADEKLIRSNGWRLLKNSSKDYRSLRRSKMKLSTESTSIYEWYHPTHGIVKSTAFDLCIQFKLEKFSGRFLSIAYGKRYEFLGWRLAINKDLDLKLEMNKNRSSAAKLKVYHCSDKNKYRWNHPIHGALNSSIEELSNLFPELRSRWASLIKVGRRSRGIINGGQHSCLGWRIE